MKNWKRRYFVLAEGKLSYYKNQVSKCISTGFEGGNIIVAMLTLFIPGFFGCYSTVGGGGGKGSTYTL